MIQFTPQETRFLQSLGRSETGRDLTELFRSIKQQLSSVNSIDSTKDYGAQVEGRKLFAEFIDEIVNIIEVRKHKVKALSPEDYD